MVRIQRADGFSFIEKCGPAPEISAEAAVLDWCAGRLPVPEVIQQREGVLIMSEVSGVNLTEVSLEDAVNVVVEALSRIHALPVQDCPLSADWSFRLRQAEQRTENGLVDEADFDEENLRQGAGRHACRSKVAFSRTRSRLLHTRRRLFAKLLVSTRTAKRNRRFGAGGSHASCSRLGAGSAQHAIQLWLKWRTNVTRTRPTPTLPMKIY